MTNQIELLYEEYYNKHNFSGSGLVKNGEGNIFNNASQCNIEHSFKGGKIINGYGFHFLYDNNENLVRIYKDGQNAGVAAMVAYYPSIDTTSIILANQTCNVWKLHREVEKVILQSK